ncbi:MAG: alkaline phosphatase family protein [Sphingobacterium sp.]|nr:alkaline phosphatase family protein [Sphingobacterium sp.]
MVLLEGASLDLIAPAAVEGRLPNFGRLLERGASMHLATMRPTQPGPVWAAVATGKLPFKNGIRSSAAYTPLASARATRGAPRLLLFPRAGRVRVPPRARPHERRPGGAPALEHPRRRRACRSAS